MIPCWSFRLFDEIWWGFEQGQLPARSAYPEGQDGGERQIRLPQGRWNMFRFEKEPWNNCNVFYALVNSSHLSHDLFYI